MTNGSVRANPSVEVRALHPEDVGKLNATGNPRIDDTDIESIVRNAPGSSFWIPATGEFILVRPWRQRDDLPHVHTLWGFGNDGPLLEAAADAAERAGAACLVMLETGERRKPAFYHQHHFERIEIIRTYEHTDLEVLATLYQAGDLEFHRVATGREELLPAVEQLDHAAFPWFWWNSRDEFEGYVSFPGVELWAATHEDTLAAYFGFTQFHHWAHLDRIAVAPEKQRLGLGKRALGFAAQRMIEGGAVRMGLSTQGGNRVSRHMYESLGFRHTRHSDYDVYGMVFDAGRVYQSPE